MKNFFQAQDEAKSKTRSLVLLFISAILALNAVTYLVVAGGMFYYRQYPSLWNAKLFLITFLCTTGLIVVESLIRIHALKKGGGSVAELLGGKKLDTANLSPDEAQLKNIVDEMSIASGTTPPDIYILKNEKSINAFVAGFATHDAALAVSQGSLDLLTREELQGVIAHEFSHLFNGDMKLNIKLIGFLNGILFLSEVGYMILRSKSTGKKRGGGVMALGLGFLILGYVGYFFARLIQSAVSREREYLADASAVQYTRNPNGIIGALKKIGGLSYGSKLNHPLASTIAHLTFSSSFTKNFSGLFATHPPLSERIKRLDPHFKATPIALETEENEGLYIGPPTHLHLGMAQNFLSSLPLEVVKAARDIQESQALILCLFLDARESYRKHQLDLIEKQLSLSEECLKKYPHVSALGLKGRLPLFDYTLPKLKALTKDERKHFLGAATDVVKCDGHISLTEWIYMKLLHIYLSTPSPALTKSVRHPTVTTITKEIQIVFSAMVHLTQETSARDLLFQKGLAQVTTEKITPLDPSKVTAAQVHHAIDTLQFASLTLKKDILTGLAACIKPGEPAQIEKYELLRALAACLNCPLPPKN